MEKINELLEKYFHGETTLAEENELKQYFRSENVSEKHALYQPLFAAFDEELKVLPQKPLAEIIPELKRHRSIWIQAFAYTGVAATIAIVFWFQRPNQSQNFAVVSGNQIQDTEFAQKYAEKKLNKVNEILNRSMKPVDNIEKVRKDMQPIQKLRNVKYQMNELQNKLQTK
ncbi:MAG: hypothetical protein WCL70_04645 [Paludibacter sp.]